jgi:hypothetical protein
LEVRPAATTKNIGCAVQTTRYIFLITEEAVVRSWIKSIHCQTFVANTSIVITGSRVTSRRALAQTNTSDRLITSTAVSTQALGVAALTVRNVTGHTEPRDKLIPNYTLTANIVFLAGLTVEVGTLQASVI